LQDKYPVILPEYLKTNKPHINNYAFIEYLSDLLPEDSLLIPGSSGACSEVTMQSFKCKKGTRVYNSEGLGSMGFGIPSSVGGCIASNKKETICIDGDGGFFMNIQELELVYRYQLPIKFFILNNNGYGSIKTTQNTHFKGNLVVSDPSSGLTLPSIELNAMAYKIPYIKISNQQNLKNDLQKVLNTLGPIICELIVDSEHKTLPKASVYKKPDGSFTTCPMEDLAPFLDRDEFLNNLLIKPISYE
jgi:acetolactate synthase-1/2/3 large subunit